MVRREHPPWPSKKHFLPSYDLISNGRRAAGDKGRSRERRPAQDGGERRAKNARRQNKISNNLIPKTRLLAKNGSITENQGPENPETQEKKQNRGSGHDWDLGHEVAVLLVSACCLCCVLVVLVVI